jgi:hypothetical protein
VIALEKNENWLDYKRRISEVSPELPAATSSHTTGSNFGGDYRIGCADYYDDH